MKKSIVLVSAALMSFAAAAQDVPSGYVSYSLPRTSLIFDVTARCEVFHAGPYAKYAAKYLGINARQSDAVSYSISDVSLSTAYEADPAARFALSLPQSAMPSFLQLSSQGLVACDMQATGKKAFWRFPLSEENVSNAGSLPANLSEKRSSLISEEGEVLTQNMIVEKSLEDKAKEVADMIFRLRENRYNILVGNTDATYSGEAMKSAVDALERMEDECIALFIGCYEYSTQRASFEIVPSASNGGGQSVAFRLSDEDGLVAADNLSGKPYYLDIEVESIAAPAQRGKNVKTIAEIHYRIPAICSVRLTDGMNSVLQTRVPVYQLGTESLYPVLK